MELGIKLGDEYFYLKVSEYILSDGTYKIEARINKVKIKARYESIDETEVQYSFKIGEGFFNCKSSDLFYNENAARQQARKIIDKIEILYIEE